MEEKQKSLIRYPCQSNKAPAASARQNNDPRAAVATGTFVPPAIDIPPRRRESNIGISIYAQKWPAISLGTSVLRFGSEAVVAVRLARVPNERSIWLDDLLTSHAMRRDLGSSSNALRGSTTPGPTTTPNRSWRSPPAQTSGSARVRLSHPLVQRPPASGGRVARAPRNRKSPCV